METPGKAEIGILFEEYKLHRQESIAQNQLVHRQTQYIQIYAVFLVSIVTLLATMRAPCPPSSSEAVPLIEWAREIPLTFKLPFLALSAAIAFYLVCVAMSSTYMFLILRKRMAMIEQDINEALGHSNFLIYEQRITTRLLGHSLYEKGGMTPHLLSAIFRIVIFLSILILLISVAGQLLSTTPTVAAIYTWGVSFFSYVLISQYLRLATTRGKKAIHQAIQSKDFRAPYPDTFRLLMLATSFGLFIVLLYFARSSNLYQQLNQVSNWAFGTATAQISSLWQTIGLIVYGVLSGTVLPTPSEAPILLYGHIPVLLILAASAIGKGIGAATIVLAVVTGKLKVPAKVVSSVPTMDGSLRGWIVYFLLQAIPFLPMRSSTAIFGMLLQHKVAALQVGIVCAFASVLRMLLMWLFISVGLVTTGKIIPTF